MNTKKFRKKKMSLFIDLNFVNKGVSTTKADIFIS